VEIEGFAQFVAVRYAELLRTAYLLTGSPHAAEDLLQSCLLKVMPRWDEIEDPVSYLRRAMVNQRTSRWRRLRRELLSERIPDTVVPDPAGGLADRTTLLAGLAGLPERMRAVVVLRYWEDLSEAETAELLRCSTGTVKSQASRGLARLRAFLGDPMADAPAVQAAAVKGREQ
jgi:RNA polymerase sigma-70 factor (sigma-E family)